MRIIPKKNIACRIIRSFLLTLILLSPSPASGQNTELSQFIVSIAEELASDDSEPEAVSEYIERLYELSENPVKLNSSSETEITRLFFLSDFQVKALTDYSGKEGKIVSVYELSNIPGFDIETVKMIIPFITLDYSFSRIPTSVAWRNNSLTSLSANPQRYDSTNSGSIWRILSRYKFISGGISGGFTIEKDPGETFFSEKPPFPDFFSANLAYNGSGVIRKIIVGDYSARFGQGTNLNTGIRTGLSLTVPGYMSARDEIKPYTSTDENNFLRGLAVELSIRNTGISVFYSKNSIDATLGSSSGFSNDFIENISRSGLHNTESLAEKKDAISEVVYGLNISYNFNNLRAGLVFTENEFSLPFKSANNDPEGVFDFKGDKNSTYTLYYNSLINRIIIFGEFSTNEFLNYAMVHGISLRPSDRLTINFLYRNYEAGYITFHGKGPGTGTTTSNEQGILGNFTFEAARHLFISGGCDLQKYEWLKYRCSSPSWGLKKEIRARLIPSEKLTIDASFMFRLSMYDKTENPGIPLLEENISRSIKGSVRYSLYSNLTLGTRIDLKYTDPSGSSGMLMFQEIHYQFIKIPVTIWARYCMFRTDDWNSRIYVYENDLLYSFSIPALSGEGNRSYFMIKWEISDIAEIRLKYGLTTLTGNGSEYENRHEVKAQIRIMF